MRDQATHYQKAGTGRLEFRPSHLCPGQWASRFVHEDGRADNWIVFGELPHDAIPYAEDK